MSASAIGESWVVCCLKLPVLHRYLFKARRTHVSGALCLVFIVHYWHKIRVNVFALVGTLERKLSSVNDVTPVLGNLCRQVHGSACASPTLN